MIEKGKKKKVYEFKVYGQLMNILMLSLVALEKLVEEVKLIKKMVTTQ